MTNWLRHYEECLWLGHVRAGEPTLVDLALVTRDSMRRTTEYCLMVSLLKSWLAVLFKNAGAYASPSEM